MGAYCWLENKKSFEAYEMECELEKDHDISIGIEDTADDGTPILAFYDYDEVLIGTIPERKTNERL